MLGRRSRPIEHYYRTLHAQGLWHRKGAALAAIGVHARDPGW